MALVSVNWMSPVLAQRCGTGVCGQCLFWSVSATHELQSFKPALQASPLLCYQQCLRTTIKTIDLFAW